MTFEQLMAIAPKLIPMLPQIEQAIATAQKIMNDSDVKAALQTAQQVAAIIEESQTTEG